MSAYEDNIKEKARQLKAKHKGEYFNPNYVPRSTLVKIAKRFVNHQLTNIESIKSIKRTVQYMIAAKMVGDKKLFEQLNEYSGEILDIFCDQIEIVDDCGDGFNRAVDRHLARANMSVYEYLTSQKIYFIDAGLVKYFGSAIFLPAYNALINVVNNRRCLEELATLIKETPNSDKQNDVEVHWSEQNIKDFIVHDGKLHVTTADSDEVKINYDEYVNEFIVDEETDPDTINISMFSVAFPNSTVNTYRQIPISKLNNGETIMIKGGIIYHNPEAKEYRIVGNYELQKFNRYHRLNEMTLAVNYTGTNDKKFWEKVNLGNLNRHETCQIDPSSTEDANVDKDFIYLFLGKTRIGKLAFRETIGFDEVKELLDRYAK